MYDPVIGRFHVQDVFAEKYSSMTPYQYGANNPILYIDVNGDSLWIKHRGEQILYENGNLYNQDGSAYSGKAIKVKKDGTTKIKGFVGRTVKALNDLSKNGGMAVMSSLQSSENNFSIQHISKNPNGLRNEFIPDNRNGAYSLAMIDANQGNPVAGGSGGNIYWDPSGGPVNVVGGGTDVRPTTNLGHELFHGWDSDRGFLDNRPIKGLARSEWRATYFENSLRSNMGLPLRSSYNTLSNGPVNILDNNMPVRIAPPSLRPRSNITSPINTKILR